MARRRKYLHSWSTPYLLLRAVLDARDVARFTAYIFHVRRVHDLLNQMGSDKVASIVNLDTNKWQNHSIHYGALSHNEPAAHAPTNRGVHPSLCDYDEQDTPLHFALGQGRDDVVDCLLSTAEIDVNDKTKDSMPRSCTQRVRAISE